MYYITYTHPTKKAKTYVHKTHNGVTLDVQRKMREAGYKLASTVEIPNETISFIKAWKEKKA